MVSLQKETLQRCCTVATLKSLPLAFPIWALIPSKYWQSTQSDFFFSFTPENSQHFLCVLEEAHSNLLPILLLCDG